MSKGSTLIDEVLGGVANAAPGGVTWFERLPADAQEELEAVRQKFDPAIHQKRAFYKAIKAAAARRGWHIAGETQVTRWLLGDQ
jgi:hypothetical protein